MYFLPLFRGFVCELSFHLTSTRRRKDVDYPNNPNWTCAREHRYVVQCFQVNGTCTACSDKARPHRPFRLVFSPTFERKCGERRRIGIVTLCYQSQDTRHFLWAEFVALAENYALKTISSVMIFSQAPSIHWNGDAKNRQKFYAIVVHGRDNLTTQNSKERCFYIADNRRLTLSAYSLLCGPTPASLTGFKAWCGGLNSLGQYRSFRLSQMRSGSTDAKSLNVSKATW